VYSASQFLGLQKNDTRTWQVQDLRPGDSTGRIGGRRNWETWGKPGATQLLGNAMHPANWDSPIVISPHDTNTLYVGMQHLFTSKDGGRTWKSLGDMTTGVDRSTLPLMGRKPSEATLSLDDGVPYFPGVTALAESPLVKGLLYAGTDDGRLRVSRNGGLSWTDAQSKLPGLPKDSWFAGVEPSRHAAGTVYVVVDNHRSNDMTNYVYRSTDYGATWSRLEGDLPPNRVARTIREDVRNPRLLYLATEFGLFISPNGGGNWVPLRANMPLMPFNDIALHARDNALVLGSHARGVWVLDQLNALQELTPDVTAMPAQLFSMQPAYQIRTTNLRPHTGDMIFRGENPANGALVDYWLRDAGASVTLTVHDSTGRLVQSLTPVAARGVNRVVWNLRHADLPVRSGGGEDDDEGPRATTPGPLALPGTYTVRLVHDGRTVERKVLVKEDPRLTVSRAERAAWTAFHREVAAALGAFAEVATRVRGLSGTDAATRDLKRQAGELQARLSTLYSAVGRWTGMPTADQRSQLRYYTRMAAEIGGQATK
jgi:hypothetical protein